MKSDRQRFSAPARLVAKHGQRMAASLRIGEEDVVPAADGGVDSHDALQREEPFVGDTVQQRLCVVEEFAGFVAPFGVVEGGRGSVL